MRFCSNKLGLQNLRGKPVRYMHDAVRYHELESDISEASERDSFSHVALDTHTTPGACAVDCSLVVVEHLPKVRVVDEIDHAIPICSLRAWRVTQHHKNA